MSAALPQTIDLRALAQRGDTLSGSASLNAFERLSEGLPVLGSDGVPVTWSARAEWRLPLGAPSNSAQLWLHLEASAQVPQTCQRCLAAFAQSVSVDRWFRFVADEATAESEDDDSEEDLLVLEPRFNLAALIEDELLLDLPLVPMHEVCPDPVRMSAGELAEDVLTQKPNPFAALAALKGGNSKA